MSRKKTEIFLLALLVLAAAVLFAFLVFYDTADKKDQITVGYISTGTVEDKGWNSMNIKGLENTCDKLGLNLMVKENVREFSGECETAVRELIEEGASVLMLNSYGYVEEISDLIEDYPDIVFYVNYSQGKRRDNVSTYFMRMYQARFLSGIVAGMKTRTNKIGYVAAMDSNEVNRGINAFTLGVRSVNPDAEVIVDWTGKWEDEKLEKEGVHKLVEKEGIDVVTYHQNQPYTIDAAEEEGIFSIGYLQGFEGYSDNYLTSVMGDWEIIYTDILKDYLQGHANNFEHYWIGLEKDAVFLSEFSPEVTDEIREEVEAAAREITNSTDVFSGEIYDTRGVLRCSANENLSDKLLLQDFDWFVDGVRFFE